MKLIFLLLASLLAMCSLAAVPRYEGRSAKLPAHTTLIDDAYQSSTAPVNSAINSATDVDKEPEDSETSYTFDNSTTASLATASEWPADEFDVDIRVGDPKQHVGTLRKLRLWQAVYDCLEHRGDLCEKQHIVYEAGKDTYSTNAHLKMKPLVGMKEREHPGLQNLAYKLISDIYRLATENDENCYWVNFKNSRRTKICNVPQWVMVVFPARGFKEPQVRGSFSLEFNGVTEKGKVDCEGTRSSITKHYKLHVRSDIAVKLGWREEKMRLFNTCQNKACFNVLESVRPGAPWSEPKGCVEPVKWEDMDGV